MECATAIFAIIVFHHFKSEIRELALNFVFICCSLQDLDLRCEELIKDEFGAECNFDVHDAIKKLEKLSIVHRVNLRHTFKPPDVLDEKWLHLLYRIWNPYISISSEFPRAD